ncbi:MAG: hypothetical protein NTW85_00260 [Methylococcales bacterium]|nr:hypothetical protein [Methylococcales bacterium]
MNKNKSQIMQGGWQDNDVGITSVIFGITSLFFLAPLFVPLALLCGILAVLKKQRVWGASGIVCAIIGFLTSPILFGVLWLAITGATMEHEIALPQSAVITEPTKKNLFDEVTAKAASISDSINCKLVSIGITTKQPCSQNQTLLPAFTRFFEEYSAKTDKKALALAHDHNKKEAWGYGFGYSSQAQANDRALLECRNRLAEYRVNADCKLYAIGNDVVWESGSSM